MRDMLLEPLQFYEGTAKQAHQDHATAFFDALLEQSGVNVEANRATVKKYKHECSLLEKVQKEIGRLQIFRVLLVIAAIIGVVLVVVGIIQFSEEKTVAASLFLGGGIVLIAAGILLILMWINPRLKDSNAKRDKHAQRAETIRQEAEAQMAPLNALFGDEDTYRLIEKTMPDFSFASSYTNAQERLLRTEYDFVDINDGESSVVDTLSGSFAGNPFLYHRRLLHEMGRETYQGTLTISWTETYTDSEGKVRTRTRTQTLYASVVKPKPFYRYSTMLCYGNQAAPDLSFSREPLHSERLNEKELEKRVRAGEKELKKKGEKATRKGGNFQEMANAEFDVLFGADDRDNEVQFRLMYTPLAQQKTVELLTSKNGFGDDFHFRKMRRMNCITSEHAQGWSFDALASHYRSHDVDAARANFINFNTAYFKSLYFDFAPLFAVPAYLEAPCAAIAADAVADSNFTSYEHEVMANALGGKLLAGQDAGTEAILKTQLLCKREEADEVCVTAYAYSTHPRIDIVPTLGGDGKLHGVPVPWTEYIPTEKTSIISVSAVPPLSDETADAESIPVFTGAVYHGMAAKIIG